MESYVRDKTKLKCQNSIRGVRNVIKIFFRTVDEIIVPDFTINYSCYEMTTELLANSGQIIPPTVPSFSAVQKSGMNYSTL